jgi:hypothetical protein
MIYNRHNQPMNISRIHLANGSSSQFKLNVDGVAGTSISDVNILANDSIFVFVQVTVNPLSSSSPMLVTDAVVFETNSNVQNVYLTAVGQNVYLHKPNHFPTNGFPAYSITGRSGHDTTLPNDKPHLFFGYVVVDSACKLTISAGTHIYMHNNSCLYVYKDGTLNITGAHSNEVTFQGDRLETYYGNIPGQYRGIWLSALSKDNTIDYAIMKNGAVGIQADTSKGDGQPTLKLTNTIIKTMQVAALYAQGAWINSYNCVFADCGQASTALEIGGKYRFYQCTFANYWNTYTANGTGSSASSNSQQRTVPLVVLNNNYVDVNGVGHVRLLDSAYFGNCIFYGDLADEIALDSVAGVAAGSFHYLFDYCLVKTGINTGNGHFYFPQTNVDPLFHDPSTNNYHITVTPPSLSPAYQHGGPSPISTDLDGNTRSGSPDLGAYNVQ